MVFNACSYFVWISATFHLLNEQQSYLIGQIQTLEIGGQLYSDTYPKVNVLSAYHPTTTGSNTECGIYYFSDYYSKILNCICHSLHSEKVKISKKRPGSVASLILFNLWHKYLLTTSVR